MHRVLLPWEYYVNVQQGRLKTQMDDLFPRWVGTRELLLNGRNPYGPEVSAEIQTAFYGHPIQQRYDKPASEIIDEQRFAYPIYIVLPLAPTVNVDFERLQAWAPFILGLFVAMTVWLWFGVLRWRPSWWAAAAIIGFVLSSPQIAQGLRLRQIGLAVAMLLALATWLVTRKRYLLGGVVLACATIKPQMIVLYGLWFVIWTTADLKRRWSLAAGFGIALSLLVGVGEILLPGWIHYFLGGLAAYQKYFPTTSPLRLILGNWLGGTLSIVAIAALLVFSLFSSKVSAESDQFVYVVALYFTASTLVLPLLVPYNQVLLLLPVLIFVRDWHLLSRAGRIALATILCWPPLAQIALLIHRPPVRSFGHFPLLPSALSLLVPFVTLWLILASWRSWAMWTIFRLGPGSSQRKPATSIS